VRTITATVSKVSWSGGHHRNPPAHQPCKLVAFPKQHCSPLQY